MVMAKEIPLGWSVERPSRACVDIRVDSFKRRKDWEFWVLLTSDRHWDNPDSDQEMQRRHMDEALEIGAPIICNGDFFCCMQGKYDKRSNKAKLRPEHQKADYFDALVRTATDFFSPYARNFAVIGKGNHETAILKNHETDLIERLVASLNTRNGTNIQSCGYGSWVRFFFEDKHSKFVIKMKRFHGHGGGGPVTKGVIQTNRRASYLSGADVIFTGHVHEEWKVVTMREELTKGGYVEQKRQLHVCGSTYKDEYKDGDGGWHIETGKPPKPIGAVWLKFHFDITKGPGLKGSTNGRVLVDAVSAL